MKRILKVYYTLILSVFLSALAFTFYIICAYNAKVLLGILGVIVTFYLGISKTQMENDKFFKELFRDFNMRYTVLNKPLYDITNSKEEIDHLTFEEKDKIYDYFNLCAEEYYWYKKNRINKAAWKSWKSGMDFWYSKPIIKKMWDDEMMNSNSRTSYYLNSREDFFKN